MNTNNRDLPFELLVRRSGRNKQTERVLCRGYLRQLAGNREVFDASWGERNIIVKVFFKRFVGWYRLKREWDGLTLLRSRGINAPQPLFYGQTSEGKWAIVTERIADSQTLAEVFSKVAGKKERAGLMKRVCTELAGQHESGIVQRDLHLGNFLLDKDRIVVLDPAEMGFSNRPIGRRKSISQLALLTSNLAGADAESIREIWREYFNRRGWQFGESDERLLETKTKAYKRKSLSKGLKKTLRTSKRFLRIRNFSLPPRHKDTKFFSFCFAFLRAFASSWFHSTLAVFDRAFLGQTEPASFIERIDELTERGEILKRDNTVCISRLTYNGKDIVVKRYNHKGIIQSLYQTIRGSRAKRSWLNCHRERMLDMAEAKLLAYIERRKSGLIWESYLVTEYVEMKSQGVDHNQLFSHPPEYFAGDRRQMLKYIPPSARRTLEFGCGFGGFSGLLKKEFSTETWAVEINAVAAQEATKKLDRVINADAAECLKELPDGYFDCIIFLDVLEHLADPYSLLLRVKSKLVKEGLIVASIPNIRYYRNLVKLAVHGDWDYEEQGILDRTHLRFFTYRSIIKTFKQLDYEILELEGINPTHSRTYRILNALLLNRLSDIRYKHFAVVARPKLRNT